MKEINTQVQEAHRVPNKMNPKRPTPKHINIKMPKCKDKERILKTAREEQIVTYKGVHIRMLADFSTETFQASEDWHKISKAMKNKNLQVSYHLESKDR